MSTEDTHGNLLKAIQDNHAALIAAQQAQIESNTRRAEECLRLRQAEEMRVSEERLRRETYSTLIEKLDFFLSQSGLMLEVLRMIALPILKSSPPESPNERHTVERLLKSLDSNELLKWEKIHSLEKAHILETDVSRKLKIKEEIQELRGL